MRAFLCQQFTSINSWNNWNHPVQRQPIRLTEIMHAEPVSKVFVHFWNKKFIGHAAMLQVKMIRCSRHCIQIWYISHSVIHRFKPDPHWYIHANRIRIWLSYAKIHPNQPWICLLPTDPCLNWPWIGFSHSSRVRLQS